MMLDVEAFFFFFLSTMHIVYKYPNPTDIVLLPDLYVQMSV